MLIMSNGRYLVVQHQRKVCRCLFMDIWKRKGCTKLTYSVTSKNSCTAHFFTDNLINDSSMELKKKCTLILTICARGTPRRHLSVRTLIIEVRHHY